MALRVGPDGRIASVAPALELVDLDLPFDRLEPILAGDIFHRGVIFGPETTLDACENLQVTVTTAADGAELAQGTLTEDPATTLEAVRTFLAAHGVALEPGHRVIAGSLIPPLPVTPGANLVGLLRVLGVAHRLISLTPTNVQHGFPSASA